MKSKFKTVTLIGSTKFKESYNFVAMTLTRMGYRVLTSFIFKGDFSDFESPGLIPMLNALVRDNIDISDLVYVIDEDHYIGESTHSEIEYALSLHKPIRYFSNDYDGIKHLEDSELELLRRATNDMRTKGVVSPHVMLDCNPTLCEYCERGKICTYLMEAHNG